MRNYQKNGNQYLKVKEVFEDIGENLTQKKIESTTSKAYHLFLGGYTPSEYPASDFGKKVISSLSNYCHLLSDRKKVEIAGGKREIALETEAFDSLLLAEGLARELLVPLFKVKSDVSNKIFNDIHYLSLAYVHAIVNGVADEYINAEEAFEAKSRAVNLAKQGVRVHDSYLKGGFSNETSNNLDKFKRFLNDSQKRLLRHYELVPTAEKKIYKRKELMKALEEKVAEKDSKGKFLFKPDIIFPIAHGGTGVGVELANTFEDLGCSPITYPLLYSIKTRKHRHPWIQHDLNFLGGGLEGKDVLITEDWVTTGNTLRGILNKLENLFPHEIRVATIKRDREKSKVPLLEK